MLKCFINSLQHTSAWHTRKEKKKFAGPAAELFRPVRFSFPIKQQANFKSNCPIATRLKEHIKSAHAITTKEFSCEFCAKQFLTLRQLKNHQVYHEEPKFSCKFCSKKFFKSVLLEGHHKTHLEQKDFKCAMCEQKYFLKSHLIRHIRSAHNQVK